MSGAAGGGVAKLGAGQPRPSAGRQPGRTGAGAGRRHAAADPARTPTLYYGDEIGMHQVAIASEQVRDSL